jgi:hypothetical protein
MEGCPGFFLYAVFSRPDEIIGWLERLVNGACS